MSVLISVFKRVEVSSDYDQKESTARNWLRALGPFSEPTAIYHLDQSLPGPNLTLLWLDPLGNVADVSHLSIPGDSLVSIFYLFFWVEGSRGEGKYLENLQFSVKLFLCGREFNFRVSCSDPRTPRIE